MNMAYVDIKALVTSIAKVTQWLAMSKRMLLIIRHWRRPMNKIQVEHPPNESRQAELGFRSWDIWTKEVSEFPWHYDEQEICYFLEGEVVVTPQGGEPVGIRAGDLVTFPVGMSCTWKVLKPVRKHYRFPTRTSI